ncbi:MAG: dephospho-CoA kinase [Dethiobacteria bacterium]
MLVVGLTGGIACGKSTVAAMLAKKGAIVIDADQIARDLVRPQKPAWSEIVNCFGEEILNPDNTLNRSLLGKLVFKEKKKRLELERIIHPRVKAEINRICKRLEQKNFQGVLVLDVPLLVETKMYKNVDFVVVVVASEDIQVKRLQKRNLLTVEEALRRISAQMPLEKKKGYADFIIENNGNLTETEARVEELWRILKRSLPGENPED